MIKGGNFQEVITVLNVKSPNNRVSAYMRQKLIELQEEIDEFTIIVGDLNTLLTEIDRSSRHKIIKDMVELNSTINLLGVIDNCRLLHPTTSEYIFF